MERCWFILLPYPPLRNSGAMASVKAIITATVKIEVGIVCPATVPVA